MLVVCLMSMGVCGCDRNEASLSDDVLAAMFQVAGMKTNIEEYPAARSENFPSSCMSDKILVCGEEEIFLFSYQDHGEYIDEFVSRNWKVYYKDDLLLVYRGENKLVLDVLEKNF